MFIRVRCTQDLPMGLFKVEKDTEWGIESVEYSEDALKSLVLLKESNGLDLTDAYIKVPQSVLAEYFEVIQEV